jgi:hypothetical protein
MKKYRNKIIVVFYSLLFLSIFLIIVYKYHSAIKLSITKERINHYIIENNINKILKTGDVICRKGNGFWSDMCRDFSQHDKRFSHVGIIINENDKNVTVLHADVNDYTGIGSVTEVSLVDFLLNGDGAAVYRLREKNQSIEDSSILLNITNKYMNRPFDYKLDLSESEKIYCTEFIYCIFTELKPAITLKVTKMGDKPVVPVDSCNDPELFFEILLFPNFHKS